MKPTVCALPTGWHRFERASLPATPWKNGGGLTREIVCQPPGAGLDAFDWRVSIARIASDGPFSAFPGVDRVITLLEGGGVCLDSAEGARSHRLDQPWQPFAFAGETAIDSRLLDGPCEDFNVMTRRAACRATVRVLRPEAAMAPVLPDVPEPSTALSEGLCLVLQGAWHPAERPALSLATGQGLWWAAPAGPRAWQAQGHDAALLWVGIERQALSKE